MINRLKIGQDGNILQIKRWNLNIIFAIESHRTAMRYWNYTFWGHQLMGSFRTTASYIPHVEMDFFGSLQHNESSTSRNAIENISNIWLKVWSSKNSSQFIPIMVISCFITYSSMFSIQSFIETKPLSNPNQCSTKELSKSITRWQH